MESQWKLEQGIFYASIGDTWTLIKARDIYCSAQNIVNDEKSVLPPDFEPIKNAFPDIRFSKFSVSPLLKLQFLLPPPALRESPLLLPDLLL